MTLYLPRVRPVMFPITLEPLDATGIGGLYKIATWLSSQLDTVFVLGGPGD
jgi:hypothetical protein